MGDAGSDDDDPDFFKNVYGQSYSRPISSAVPRAPERKRESPEGSTSPEKVDPNELPRDFSARGAKLWEDQAKASERNWKRRREEELMCKLCGEKGHFAQGCPTTLKKDATIKLTLHDRRLKPRLIGAKGVTIQKVQQDTGCRIQLEDIPPLPASAPDGSFRVIITAPDGEKAGKGRQEVERLVAQFEEEWRVTAAKRGVGGGVVWGGPGWGGVAAQPVVGAEPGVAVGGGLPRDGTVMQQVGWEMEAARMRGGAEERGGGGWQGVEGYPPPVRSEDVGFSKAAGIAQPASEGELEQYMMSRRADLSVEEGGEVEKEKKRHREKLKEVELRFQLLESQLTAEENRLRKLIPSAPTPSAYPSPYAHLQGKGATVYEVSGYSGVPPGSLGAQLPYGVQGHGQTSVGSAGTNSYAAAGVPGHMGGYGGGLQYSQAGEGVMPSYNQDATAVQGGTYGSELVYPTRYQPLEVQGGKQIYGQDVSYQGVGGGYGGDGYGGGSWKAGEEGKSNGYKFSYGMGYQS